MVFACRSSRVFSECFGNHAGGYDGPLDPLVTPCDIAQPDDNPSIAAATQGWSAKVISDARLITSGLARVTAAALSSLSMNSCSIFRRDAGILEKQGAH